MAGRQPVSSPPFRRGPRDLACYPRLDVKRPRISRPIEFLIPAAIAALAAVLLFWNLADRYLWQDEAATAVLAQRMLEFGRPLAYDGVNLVTIDMHSNDDEAVIAGRTRDPAIAVDYYRRRGNFKSDTTWKWHPWGLFLVPALSFKLLGATTLAARLPFALAGLATVLLLFRLIQRYSGSLPLAAASALLLVLNPYWILHVRQCRYYSLSSLFLVLTLMGYARWQWKERGGAAAFLAAAWCWFQVDYGTVWPIFAVLFADAFLSRRRSLWQTTRTGAILAATLAPFVYYYELWGRGSSQEGTWIARLQDNLFNMNEYVATAVVLLAAVALLLWRWRTLAPAERCLAAVSCGILLAIALWVPTVSVYPFVRYSIVAAPAGAFLTAWVLARIFQSWRPWLVWLGVAIVVVTPWLSLPLHPLAPAPDWDVRNPWVRTELSYFWTNVFEHRPDPNRIVIDWLRRNAAPSDEILINYEDLPLMFYLPNPIRGGVPAFRVEDDVKTRPRFVVLRHSVDFVHWPAFERELARYQWAPVPLKAPDIIWGNNPDPMGQDDPRAAPDLYIARRIGP
jgi:hypothetical protein